jgi:hypothetical protein
MVTADSKIQSVVLGDDLDQSIDEAIFIAHAPCCWEQPPTLPVPI